MKKSNQQLVAVLETFKKFRDPSRTFKFEVSTSKFER